MTGEIVMNDVEVPEKYVTQYKWFKGPFGYLSRARYGISWGVIELRSIVGMQPGSMV